MSTFLILASVVVCVVSGWLCCLPLSGCAIDGSLCKICTGPSIFAWIVSLDASFFLRCASPRRGVDIVLLLMGRSLLLLYVMVDVCCFRCRWLLRRTCTGGYVPRAVEIGGMVYIRDNEQANNRKVWFIHWIAIRDNRLQTNQSKHQMKMGPNLTKITTRFDKQTKMQ